MKLEINVPVSGLDLANLLDGEQGAFLCQNWRRSHKPRAFVCVRS